MSVRPGDAAVDALQALPAGFDVVVDDAGEAVGTVSDVHVRRALLAADDPAILRVADVMDRPDAERPDRDGGSDAIVVVMAGGRGERLRPLTDHLPKPLLAVGRTTILERLLERLFESGFADVWLAVNYMADKIEQTIGDGSRWGIRVRYLREDEPLHTAGALSLLPERPRGPIVVLNADQVTRLSFARMVDYHLAEEAAVTIGVFFHEEQVKYGVVDLDGNAVVGMREKPTLRWPCNAGFYVIDPAMLDLVPPGRPFSMPDLAAAAMAGGYKVVAFPIVETWLDIGNFEDLNNALMWFVTGEEL
jgi:NDP-sugar pyrophosphorylase family protein